MTVGMTLPGSDSTVSKDIFIGARLAMNDVNGTEFQIRFTGTWV